MQLSTDQLDRLDEYNYLRVGGIVLIVEEVLDVVDGLLALDGEVEQDRVQDQTDKQRHHQQHAVESEYHAIRSLY